MNPEVLIPLIPEFAASFEAKFNLYAKPIVNAKPDEADFSKKLTDTIIEEEKAMLNYQREKRDFWFNTIQHLGTTPLSKEEQLKQRNELTKHKNHQITRERSHHFQNQVLGIANILYEFTFNEIIELLQETYIDVTKALAPTKEHFIEQEISKEFPLELIDELFCSGTPEEMDNIYKLSRNITRLAGPLYEPESYGRAKAIEVFKPEIITENYKQMIK